jgi:glycosyltransferase involved in cell wall biosynthesis
MISVVMANYNGERYIREAISSVVNQDYDDYEFIVVDDGSVDGSRDIIAHFHNQHPDKVKPIYHEDNLGQGMAFNHGIAASAGDIACFLDSDDLWFPSKLSNVSEALSRSQGVAVHQHNLLCIRNGESTGERFCDVLVNGDYFGHTRKTRELPIFVATSGLSFPRKILDKVLPIPQAFKTCADGYLTRTCFCHGEVVSTNECWGAYRIHDANYVFENSQFDVKSYVNQLLIPALNEYYEGIGIEFKYSVVHKGLRGWLGKLLDASPRRVYWFARRRLTRSEV